MASSSNVKVGVRDSGSFIFSTRRCGPIRYTGTARGRSLLSCSAAFVKVSNCVLNTKSGTYNPVPSGDDEGMFTTDCGGLFGVGPVKRWVFGVKASVVRVSEVRGDVGGRDFLGYICARGRHRCYGSPRGCTKLFTTGRTLIGTLNVKVSERLGSCRILRGSSNRPCFPRFRGDDISVDRSNSCTVTTMVI